MNIPDWFITTDNGTKLECVDFRKHDLCNDGIAKNVSIYDMTATDACCTCGGGLPVGELLSTTEFPDYLCLETSSDSNSWMDGTFVKIDISDYNGITDGVYLNINYEIWDYVYLYYYDDYYHYEWYMGTFESAVNVAWDEAYGFTQSSGRSIPYNSTWYYLDDDNYYVSFLFVSCYLSPIVKAKLNIKIEVLLDCYLKRAGCCIYRVRFDVLLKVHAAVTKAYNV